uniref:Putative secreted protein n=1 Tax=Anopheles marajoara TaxID=58244 RepID=A0A2M4CDD3_9DIPT
MATSFSFCGATAAAFAVSRANSTIAFPRVPVPLASRHWGHTLYCPHTRASTGWAIGWFGFASLIYTRCRQDDK